MRLVLKSYSQDVDISDPDSAVYLLTFHEEVTGSEVRLPVQLDTVLKLVQESARLKALTPGEEVEGPPAPVPAAKIQEPEEHPEGAAIFGDEEDYEESEDGVGSL
jgi:hypothetical protein